MTKLSMLFANLAGLLLLSSCAQFRTSDFPLVIRLPASRECFEVKVMSGTEKRYSPEECDKIVAQGIILTSEAWKLLRGDIQTNCQYSECKQIRGAADGLFLSLDQALDITLP